MKTWFAVLISCLLLAGPVCARDAPGRVYDQSDDAAARIEAALAKADARAVNALLVFGANGCHDSRGPAERYSSTGG